MKPNGFLRSFFTKSLFAISFVSALSLPTAAVAQTTAFGRAMMRLAKQNQIFIVVEGIPLNSEMEPPDPSMGKLGDRVTQIGAAYDYGVRVIPGGYALFKKYTDHAELPCVTIGEVEAMARDAARLTQQACPPLRPIHKEDGQSIGPTSDLTRQFFRSLSPSQRQQAATSGIRFTSLSPEQQKLSSNDLKALYVNGTVTASNYAISLFSGLSTGRVTFKPLPSGQKTIRLAMLTPQPKGLAPTPFSCSLDVNGIAQTIGQLDKKPVLNVNYLAATENIGDFLLRLNNSRGADDLECSVLPILSEKPLQVFGENYVSHQRAVVGIARLYGLRVAPQAKGVRLVLPSRPTNVSAATLQNALLAIVPLPLQQAMAPRTSVSVNRRPSFMQAASALPDASFASYACLWLRASLLETAKETVKGNALQNQGLIFSKMTPRQQSAVGIILSRLFFEHLAVRMNRVPPYIRRMDNLLIVMRQVPGGRGGFTIVDEIKVYNEKTKKYQKAMSRSTSPGIPGL